MPEGVTMQSIPDRVYESRDRTGVGRNQALLGTVFITTRLYGQVRYRHIRFTWTDLTVSHILNAVRLSRPTATT